MRIVRWCAAGAVVGCLLVVPSRPVSAELTNDDGCTASATWASTGMVVDAGQTGTVTIPRADTVQWTGSVPAAPGDYEGSVTIQLPKPFGELVIDEWSGTSATTSNQGVEEYELPAIVPAGVPITLHGRHVDANGVCAGRVTLQIEGSPMSSPITWVALGGTAVTGAAMLALVRPLFRRIV